MPNEVKYNPQLWGEPIPGEVLSVNAQYCGQKMGVPTIDALFEGEAIEELSYSNELATVRLGTVMQDAIEGSTPEKA